MPIDYAEKYDVAAGMESSILGKAKNFTVATLADIGTTLWNSLPFTSESSTEEVLSKIDSDALTFYTENPNAVQLTSLIGGALVPGGVAMKLLGRARAGLTSLGYTEGFISGSFTGARQKILTTEIENVFRAAGAGGKEYQSLKRQIYASGATQQILDNAVIELAVVGAMNAHPFMEDYTASTTDFLKNFTIGVAAGGVLGAAFSAPVSTKLIRDATSRVEVQAAANVLESGFKPVPLGMTSAARVQLHGENVKILEGLIANRETDDYTKTMLSNLLAQETQQLDDVVVAAMPKNSNIDEKMLKGIMRGILSKTELEGVDKVKLINMDKVDNTTSKLILNKMIDPSFVTADDKAAVVFYRPSTGETFDFTGARNAATAADVTNASTKIRILSKEYKNQYGRPNTDFEDDIFVRASSSAQLDLRYLAEMNAIDTLNLESLRNVVIGPRDLPRMHALVAKIQQLSPEEQASVRVRVTSDQPSYAKQQTIIKKIIEDEKLVAPDYLDQISKLQRRSQTALNNGQLSEGANDLVSFWISGTASGGKQASKEFPLTASTGKGYGDPDNQIGIQAFRLLYSHVIQGGALPKGMEDWVPAMKEIIAEGQKLRPDLEKIADPEGYIYLYRGSKHKLQGSTVESYSWNRNRTAAFGTPYLARVHIDDVVGVLNSEDEILVRAHSPKLVDNIPTEPRTQMSTHIEHLIDDANSIQGNETVSLDKLSDFYFQQSIDLATQMMQKGFSVEEISARLNLTKEGVLSIMMQDFDSINWNAFRYTDVTKTGEYIDVQNKMFTLVGNPQRNSMAFAISNLDRRQAAVANNQIIKDFTVQSGSVIANRVADIYASEGAQAVLGKIADQLATVVNSMTGNFRWQSADQMLRALEIGPIITGLGKRFIDTTDALRKELLEPVATAFQVFREDTASLAGFNRVVNKLAALKGWRELVPESAEAGAAWNIVQREKVNGKTVLVPVEDENGAVFRITQDAVKNALDATRKVSDEIFRLHNLNKTITGSRPINDLGFYIPPISLVGKSYSFVVDKTGQKPVQLLVANSSEELVSLEQAWKAANTTELGRFQLFAKGEQEAYSALNEYQQLETHVTYANVAYQHKGRTAQAILPSDFRMVENLVNSYENLVLQGARRYHESFLHDTMYWLDEMSNFYQRTTADQPKRGLNKELAKNAPLSVKNMLLGRDQLEQSVGLKATNSLYDLLLNKAVAAIDNHVKAPIQRKQTTQAYYDDLVKKLEAEGVPPLWKSFDEYLVTTSSDARNVSSAVQSAGNGLLATMNLRMFEVAQAAVNIMSLPILTWAALMERLPGTAVGASGASVKFPLRVMYDGIRHMNSAEGKRLSELWEQQGLLNQATRQFTETTADLKSAYRGGRFSDRALEIVNNIQENRVVRDFFSKPADWAEGMTRKISMHTGYMAAKSAYPGIDDFSATIAAMNFMDRSIGNYHAAQRPGVFQGTFGAAIGLYQTYFLTYAQGVYRGIENRNFRQLATQMLSQAGIFGMSSMPGYSILSENIVANMNNSHWDITSGTYRAVGDPMAELILYGLPSSIGPAFYTRGDVSPRIPTGPSEIAVVNGIGQAWEAASTLVSKTASGLQNGNVGQSMMEALSLQSLNRPIARWAELVSGESITRQGNTVSPSSEVWTPVGIASRLLGTRPMEEQVVRNAVYSNKFYEALDFEKRQAAVSKLKTALRAGSLSDSLISETALSYLKSGGDAKGWTSAMNELLLKTEEGARWDLLKKLEPGSPLRAVIDDLY